MKKGEMMEQLKINEQSIKTELKEYENNPFNCLCEYIWNAFDANAKSIELTFELMDLERSQT